MDNIIIGVDGLDPELVREWKSKLPTLHSLINEGSFGELNSSYPPLSSPAWPTLFTGKQGGKHGVFGFTKEQADSHERVPVNYVDVTAESIWEVLDKAGVSIGTVNVPLSYPPSDLENGYVIAGWPVPNRVEVGNPRSIVEEVEKRLGESYQVHPFPMQPELERRSPAECRELLAEGLWHHQRAFEVLIDIHPVDVFFCVFMAIDHASHHLAWNRDELQQMYIEQDQALGELLDVAPAGIDIVLVSDHGHGAKGDRNFHTNNWLAEEGYLTKTDNGVDEDRLLRTVGVTQENAVRAKNALGINDVRTLLPQWLFDRLEAVIPPSDETKAGFDPSQIDWQRTVAYSGMQNTIFLTDDVPSDEREPLRQKLVEHLQNIEYPAADRDDRLVTYAYTKGELFDGPYFEDAPDVVFVTDEMRCKANVGFSGSGIFTDQRWGEHRQHGVFVTAGPSFTSRSGIFESDIKDVFPLLCALLDVPAPDGIDGDLAVERFAEEPTLRLREDSISDRVTERYSDSETEDVREQLENLGYLE